MTTAAQHFAAHQAGVARRRVEFDRKARMALLDRLRDKVLAEEDAICAAIHSDFGKHAQEVRLTEIIPLLIELRHTSRHLRKWMRPRRAAPGLVFLGTSTRVHPVAKGTSLVIAPWNFPFMLALGPVVSAIAAGCSVILKPSEHTPATSDLLARLVAEVFPADLVTVVQGGVDVSTELLALPFDHIFFTGSPQVGQIVAQAAAKTHASVTLELGGKSPTIVGPDANIRSAARWIAWGRFMNAGQTCVAPDHLYVHETVMAPLIDALKAQIAKMYGDDPLRADDLAQLAHPGQFKRVAGLLSDAGDRGARIIGGQIDAATRKIAPTLLTDLKDDMDIQGPEIFGPLLPIMPYSDPNDVIGRINAAPHPLALYVFGGRDLVDKVITRTQSGTVGVNLTVMGFAHPSAPFGGVGQSGNGGAHGHAGFAAFSHMRPVLHAQIFPFHLLFPPYTGGKRRLISLILRIVRL